jgi:dynein heavy chain
VTIEERV